MNRSFITLFNVRDKLVNRGCLNHNLSDGAIEFKVEAIGFKKTLQWLKGL